MHPERCRCSAGSLYWHSQMVGVSVFYSFNVGTWQCSKFCSFSLWFSMYSCVSVWWTKDQGHAILNVWICQFTQLLRMTHPVVSFMLAHEWPGWFAWCAFFLQYLALTSLIQPLLWVHGDQRHFLLLLWTFHKKFPWQKHSTKNCWGIFLNPGGLIRLVRLSLHTFPAGKPVSLEYAPAMRVLLDLQPCSGRYFAQIGIHMASRTQGFPAEQYTVRERAVCNSCSLSAVAMFRLIQNKYSESY